MSADNNRVIQLCCAPTVGEQLRNHRRNVKEEVLYTQGGLETPAGLKLYHIYKNGDTKQGQGTYFQKVFSSVNCSYIHILPLLYTYVFTLILSVHTAYTDSNILHKTSYISHTPIFPALIHANWFK